MLVLGEGLLRLLIVAGAAAAGCLLVLEDLHWADPDTVAIVGYLADAARHSSIVIAVTAWDDQPGAPRSIRPVDSVVGTLSRHDGMVTVWLDRLDEAGTAALAAAHAAGRPIDGEALAALIDHADGLPLLVEDLLPAAPRRPVRAGTDATHDDRPRRPAHGRAGSRCSTCAAGCRRTRRGAGLVTRRSDRASWTPRRRGGTARRHGNGLLSADGRTQLVWRHSLTRAAVLAGLVPTERAALVDRVADLLLARGSDDDEALAADLLAQAGESARATAILLRLARTRHRPGSAACRRRLLGQRAASLGAPAAQLAIDRTRLLTLLGRAGEALDDGIPVLDALSGDDHAELCLELARAAIVAGRWEQAQRLVDTGGPPGRPAVARPRGRGVVRRRRRRAGHRNRPRRRRGGRAADGPELLCAALVIAGRCASLASNELADANFGRAAQCAAEHGLVPWRVEALFGLGLAELTDGRPTRSLTQARELALDAGC